VLVYSPAELQRAAWCALLSQQAQIQVQGAADTVRELASLNSSHFARAVLVDVTSGQLALAQELSGALPGVGLLFLVDGYDLDDIVALLRTGVSGCLARDEVVANLARNLIAVGRGEIALPAAISGRALAMLARGTPMTTGLIEPLSERETEVLRLLAGGLTNKDIAQELILSVRTVEAHLRNIFGKLDVRSRTEAALWAVRKGYVHEPDMGT
jgi:DNA-binding NarL/FixJ family response regulator